jgi:ketosteroid isomerase-like protein
MPTITPTIHRVLSYYHGEAVLMPPGKDEIRGMENIRQNYENILLLLPVKSLSGN